MSGSSPQNPGPPLIPVSKVRPVGAGLNRPESVQVMPDGTIFVSHRERGVSVIRPDGTQHIIGGENNLANGQELIPNGIAPLPDGSFLLANIGEGGGIWRLTNVGKLEPHLMEVDGQFLSAANFVMTDAGGRIWITVSTVSTPRFEAYTDQIADGLIIVMDDRGARIVADDICFANECRPSPDGRSLLVSETFSRRVTRFDVGADGGLSGRETFAQFGRGDFPDGCRFDADGHLWLTCIVANRVWRIAPDGTPQLILEDCDFDHVDWVEAALADGQMGREHFYKIGKTKLGNVASIDFAPDHSVAYLGSLCGTELQSFPTDQIIGAGR